MAKKKRVGSRSIDSRPIERRTLRSAELTRFLSLEEIQELRDRGRSVTMVEEGVVQVNGFGRFRLKEKDRAGFTQEIESDLTGFGEGLERTPGGRDVITF